jgi:hypothetical protein
MLPFRILMTLLVLANLLSACGVSQQFIHTSRNYPTGLVKGDRIAVVLSSYKDCEKYNASDCDTPKESEYEEASVGRCLELAISSKTSASVFITAQDFRRQVLQGENFERAPRTEDEILAILSDEVISSRIAALGIRYIVTLQFRRSVTPERWTTETDMGVTMARQWERGTSTQAVVLDVHERKRSGTVSLNKVEQFSRGTSFYLYVIPSPSREQVNIFDSNTCRPLGIALAEFLKGKN